MARSHASRLQYHSVLNQTALGTTFPRLSVRAFGIFILALVAGLNALAQVPDLTNGGVPGDTDSFNVGPTGLRGWTYHEGTDSSLSRQILVMTVDTNSPANGILQVDDVILGADGTGVAGDPALFSADARVSIADAIADAEARSPATLKLLNWRSGATNTVTLTLETMGAYASTAPYGCVKSSNILDKCVNYVCAADDPGWNQLGLLILLAANDPSNPSNALYQAKAQTWARKLTLTQSEIDEMTADGWRQAPGKPGWSHSYRLLALAEYYLQTGDVDVYPTMEAYAICFSKNQSWFGTTGHKYADDRPDGGNNGAISGYGAINGSGVAGFLGLRLAREAGVNDPAIDPAITRADHFFASFAGKSGIPYGEHEYSPGGSMYDMNGKNATAALAFQMDSNRVSETRFFAKMTMDSSKDRQNSHAGPYFNYVWPALGAAVVGEKAAAHYFGRTRWLFDLARRWDGAMVFDHFGTSSSYNSFPPGLTTLLTYALPQRQLYMTGRGHDPAVWLSTTDFNEAVASEDFDATSCDTNQLMAALGDWSPLVRNSAAKELATRTGDIPALLPILHSLVSDTNASDIVRNGATIALKEIADPSSAPVLVGLLTDSVSYVRYGAAMALRYLPRATNMTYIDSILSAAATTIRPAFPMDDDDPIQFAHGQIAMLLFYSGNAYGPKGLLYQDISGIDRGLLYSAIRGVAQTPAGLARSTLGSVYGQLSYDEMLAVADAVVETIRLPAPADAMFAGGVRTKGEELLRSYDIAEGVPLCKDYSDREMSHALGMVESYAGSCLTVEPDPEMLPFLYDAWVFRGSDISNAVAAIVTDTNPISLIPLKSIDSVIADSPSLTLPSKSTFLRVSSTNYVKRIPQETTYSWRMVYGAGDVTFLPNDTWDAKETLLYFADAAPGQYRFEVTMSDDLGYTIVRDTIDVTLYDELGGLPPNSQPTADPQSITVAPGVPEPVTLTGSDPEGDDLSFNIVAGPDHGDLSGAIPFLLYTANFGYTGADSFSFEVVDGGGLTATATVSITVASHLDGATIYEPFDYPAGSLDGQSGASEVGLDGSWSASGPRYQVVAGSFTYPALPGIGGCMRSPGWGRQDPATRALNAAAMAQDGILDDGGELWFSVVLGVKTNINRTNGNLYFGLKDGSGGGADVGFWLDVGALLFAEANGAFGDCYASTGNKSLTFPVEEPELVVGRCTWGDTALDLDTVTIYRVPDDSGDQPFVLQTEMSTLSTNISQADLDTLYFEYNENFIMDEIRVGPTYQSVLLGTTALADDLTAPTPDPMYFAELPQQQGGSSITMTAATAYDERGVEYYFTCTQGGGNDSGWQDSSVYSDTGLTPGVTYGYTVTARDKSPNQNSTTPSGAAWVAIPALPSIPDVTGVPQSSAERILNTAGFNVGSVTTSNSASIPVGYVVAHSPAGDDSAPFGTAVDLVVAVDLSAPEPNPATFLVAPQAIDASSVTMTATTGIDLSGPVEYLFTETSGHAGGSSSGWQTSSSYTDTGLSTMTLYSYTVQMRDATGNTGTASSPISVTTSSTILFEDFEPRPLGDLHGQNGWVASNTVVQASIAIDTQAGLMSEDVNKSYMQHAVGGGQTNVWTDLYIQPALADPGVPLTPDGDAAVGLYFDSDAHPVAYDGTNAVTLTGTTVSTGTWTRVTIHADFVSKTWDLYINDNLVADDYGFYYTGAASFSQFGARGGYPSGTAIDDISVDLVSPFAPPPLTGFKPTLVIIH